MREFLVTKLVCAKCGNKLSLSTDRPKTTRHAEGEPTGADMLELAVAVEPCEVCMEPLERMRRAVDVLLDGKSVGRTPWL